MSRIVEGLSFLAWRDAGRMETPLPMADVDLDNIAHAVVAEFQPLADQKGVTMRPSGAPRAGPRHRSPAARTSYSS